MNFVFRRDVRRVDYHGETARLRIWYGPSCRYLRNVVLFLSLCSLGGGGTPFKVVMNVVCVSKARYLL